MTRKGIVRAAWAIAAGFVLVHAVPVSAAPSDSAAQAAEAGKPLVLTKSAKPRAKVASRKPKAKVAPLRTSKASKTKRANREQTADTAMPAAIANAKAEMPQAEARGAAAIAAPAATVTPLEVTPSEPMPTVLSQNALSPNEPVNEFNRATAEESEPRAIKTELVKDDQPQAALPIVVADNAPNFPQSTAPGRTSSASVAASSGDAWEQSSLIGKIFIAFGGMLTLASAARMLIA